MDLLSECGYRDPTIEGIAGGAGVGKATIYRWWSSRGALVGETHSLRDDLRRAVRATVENYSNTIAGVVAPGLVSDIVHDVDLRDSFPRRFIDPRRAGMARLLQRAVDERALPPDNDMDLVIDIWAGAVFYRSLSLAGP